MSSRWSACIIIAVAACSGTSHGGDDADDDDGPMPSLDQLEIFAIEHPRGDARGLYGYQLSSDRDWYVMPGASFRWSPDRTAMVIVADNAASGVDDPGALTLLRLADSATTMLAGHVRTDGTRSAIRWSPDSAYVAIDIADAGASAGHRWTVFDRDGAAHATIDEGDGTYEYDDVSYSAAGHLVFRDRQVASYCEADGTACVTDPPQCPRSPDDALIACGGGAGMVFTRVADGVQVGAWSDAVDSGAWSADGLHFAGVSVHDDDGLAYVDLGAITDAAPTTHLRVGSDDMFAWSPDGAHVAFSIDATSTSGRGVAIAGVDGSGRLDHGNVNWGHWLHAGTFATNDYSLSGKPALLVAGDPVERIVDGPGGVQIVWFDDDGDQGVAPDGTRFAYAAGGPGYLCSTATAHCDPTTSGLLGQVGWAGGDALLLLQSLSTTDVLGTVRRVPPGTTIGAGQDLSFDASVVSFTVR